MAYHIGILQLTQQLDDAVQGFKQGLSALAGDVRYTYLNADGNLDRLSQLAKELTAAKVDLIFACSTPAAQAVQALGTAIPLVFTPVFDPVGAGLVASFEHPGGNATGMSGMVPAPVKVQFIRKLLPNANRLTLLYPADDPNSRLEAANFTAASEGIFTLSPVLLTGAADISHLPDLLSPDTEGIFLPIGRIVEENFASIIYYADQLALPVVASHPPNVSAGAIGAVVANHTQLGKDCAKQAALIIAGTPAGNIPVGVVAQPDILLNRFAAEELNLLLPPDLVAIAAEIYD